ncbi:MAG: methionyl-tRNA formyltransferase [Ferruginibacter sp.]
MIEQKLKTANLHTTASFPLKNQEGLRIVFMGTPEFAVAALDKLVQAGCNIVGVITAPDKEAGRGMQLQQSAVKKYASEHGLYILQPEKLKHPAFIDQLKNLHADLQIVVAFRMLPEVVWNMPPMGTINLHGSLLPQYRGAAPINWAIINGENETGLTTFKLQHEIDTGNILLTERVSISEDETAGQLHDRMKETGAELLLQTVKGLENGHLIDTPQSLSTAEKATPAGELGGTLKHAPKIFTETCRIDWAKSMDDVYNLIRGLSPYPAAFSFLDGKKIKIYKAEKVNALPSAAAGEIETDKKTFLMFACNNGFISIKELQLEGKKKMLTEDFLRGYRWADL